MTRVSNKRFQRVLSYFLVFIGNVPLLVVSFPVCAVLLFWLFLMACRLSSSASRRTQFASSSSLVRTSRRLGAVGTTTFSQSKVPERTDHDDDDGDKQTTQNNRATVTMPLRPFCEQRGSSANEAETGLPTGGAYANGSGAGLPPVAAHAADADEERERRRGHGS